MITDELGIDAGDVRPMIVMAAVGGVPEEVWTVSATHGIDEPIAAASRFLAAGPASQCRA